MLTNDVYFSMSASCMGVFYKRVFFFFFYIAILHWCWTVSKILLFWAFRYTIFTKQDHMFELFIVKNEVCSEIVPFGRFMFKAGEVTLVYAIIFIVKWSCSFQQTMICNYFIVLSWNCCRVNSYLNHLYGYFCTRHFRVHLYMVMKYPEKYL